MQAGRQSRVRDTLNLSPEEFCWSPFWIPHMGQLRGPRFCSGQQPSCDRRVPCFYRGDYWYESHPLLLRSLGQSSSVNFSSGTTDISQLAFYWIWKETEQYNIATVLHFPMTLATLLMAITFATVLFQCYQYYKEDSIQTVDLAPLPYWQPSRDRMIPFPDSEVQYSLFLDTKYRY